MDNGVVQRLDTLPVTGLVVVPVMDNGVVQRIDTLISSFECCGH